MPRNSLRTFQSTRTLLMNLTAILLVTLFHIRLCDILIAQNQKCTYRLYYYSYLFIPSSSTTNVNITSVEGLVQKGRRVTSRRVVFDLGLSYGTVKHEVEHLTKFLSIWVCKIGGLSCFLQRCAIELFASGRYWG